jgi:ferrous iron transport protein B
MQNTLTQTKSQDNSASCHSAPQADLNELPLVVIVGSPNVGKSVLFNSLTGAYITVSNYPGTTVEVTRGKSRLGALEVGVMDTPGMYNLLPITEEEHVARKVLLNERPAAVLHVVDAKNLERMLPMTLQLIEADLPVMLVVNLLDEAERLGIRVDLAELGQRLGIPVVGTALAINRGTREMRQTIVDRLSAQAARGHNASTACTCDHANGSACPPGNAQTIRYPDAVENTLAGIENLLKHAYPLSKRAMAVLALQEDGEVLQNVQRFDGENLASIRELIRLAQAQYSQPLSFQIARAQRQAAQRLLQTVFHEDQAPAGSFASRLSDAMIHPLTGIPILLLALFILYEFVGVLGAQILVNWLETHVFNAHVNPWVDLILAQWVPWPALRSLIGGEFGVVTLGLRYAFAIILPIVGAFFIAFSIIEDSGYLPRLAMLIDRVFKKIGLNGRAVIPMVLGFGCDTMATITTRTLETRRERLISTLLLSLAIPCSAQMGVMLALLAGFPLLLPAWLAVVVGVFLLVGFLTARLMPGEQPTFYMELPPLRLPRARNVLVKTYTRMEWYLREVLPLFLVASVVIWVGTLTGLFDLAVKGLVPVVRWLGLPDQTAVAFLFGFFRRDYGAAGLYDLRGTMSAAQLLVAVVTMTLFVPCLAQFAVTIKERGWKAAVAMAAFIFPFALLVGGALSGLLRMIGVQ